MRATSLRPGPEGNMKNGWMMWGGAELFRRVGVSGGDEGASDLSNRIDIRLTRLSQLFQSLDPFPFRERDLAGEVEEYITEYASELPRDEPFEIVVHLPSDDAGPDADAGVGDAVSHFFAYRARVVARELSELFRIGRRALFIGSLVLAFCLFVAQTITALKPDSRIASFFEEGLVIVGWVAYWRPLEIFLYDWWPPSQQKKLYRRLSEAKVSVSFDQPPEPVAPGA
jgi:hypothetical protein